MSHPSPDEPGTASGAGYTPHSAWTARLQRLVQIHPQEVAAVGWSWLFFFCVLSAYYVIRPIRDDMGVAGGVANLPWLFTGSLAGMAILNPAFGFIATHLPRQRFVSTGYRFFAANLLVFFVVLHLASDAQAVWVGRAFFIWTAVFNMFVVSIFWSVMTDVFSTAQGARLFGFIGVAGTIGAITGAGLTSTLVGVIGRANLLLVSAVLLEVAAFAARTVFRTSERREAGAPSGHPHRSPLGGHAWEGITRTASDSYLRGIALHIVLFTVLTTFLYLQRAAIVDAATTDSVERTRFFANIDLLVNVITLVTQAFATGHLVRLFGLRTTLAFLPVLSLAGFLTLGAIPTVFVLMAFEVLRRSSEFAIARPTREVLFTTAAREDRYKAKNFIDTFVYRTGDWIGSLTYGLLATGLGLGISGVSSVGAGLAAVSIGVAWWLGTRHRRDADRQREVQPAA